MARELRRADLVGDGGVGAMTVLPNGVSVIVGGLDGWFYPNERPESGHLVFHDRRLQLRTDVDFLILPPDADSGQRIPVLRFPRWHFCPGCRVLHLVEDYAAGKKRCPNCSPGGRKPPFLQQAPLIAICEHGHLQDFPWYEWVHQTNHGYPVDFEQRSQHVMTLQKSGGMGLAAQRVSCKCGKSRTLRDTVGEDLGNNLLATKDRFMCRGARPWFGSLGEGRPGECDQTLWGALRSAGNVYFATTRDSIFLPAAQRADWTREHILRLVEILRGTSGSVLVQLTEGMDMGGRTQIMKKRLVAENPELNLVQNKDLERALILATHPDQNEPRQDWRRSSPLGQEFVLLADPPDDLKPGTQNAQGRDSSEPDWLTVSPQSPTDYRSEIERCFDRINLVPRLRVTKTITGLTRVRSENGLSAYKKRQLLWLSAIGDWLPAYVSLGEGFFLKFKPDVVDKWVQGKHSEEIERRRQVLQRASDRFLTERSLPTVPVHAEFVMAHTLSHLLINQLVFDCGYQAASLAERIYWNASSQDLGILIYTAAGDSDGTLGGLVRMGKAEALPDVLGRALDRATWCSSDPVCMEIGGTTGQGFYSMNLAACHNCAMVPETSCSHFNRLLDRALVVGTYREPEIGFFFSNRN